MSFKFTNERMKNVEELLTHYPADHKQAALLPILWEVQYQEGWISKEAMVEVARICGCTPAHVQEVVTFYTMYNQEPPAKYHLQVCRNICCWLRGAGETTQYLEEKLGIKPGEMTEDRKFKLSEVECLAACGGGPMMQVNDDYQLNLTRESIDKLLKDLK
ncbi:MAG: NAD(P)H-dependent oxidoreductase subunit E [Deltaproteobacteria bacterium CG11_big_fil_rev_8_21_14_0_20_47_16]|nr:MAG: NAD(P)H-dependent oxidoreductase subunit E [Deltaproteobacteria bacterium CG11_big_fil_rev_8_21_14_0_20_47_16]